MLKELQIIRDIKFYYSKLSIILISLKEQTYMKDNYTLAIPTAISI